MQKFILVTVNCREIEVEPFGNVDDAYKQMEDEYNETLECIELDVDKGIDSNSAWISVDNNETYNWKICPVSV